MEDAIRIFNEYVKSFDMTDKMILLKYHHSLRVMEIARNIADSLDVSENNVLLASLCGLFHDIGRFTQWTTYNTFKDQKSKDHGDLGVEVMENGLLKQLELDKEQENILLSSIKYHNKFEVITDDERVRLFDNISRDADKLDLLETQCLANHDEEIVIKKELLNQLLNGELCKNELVDTDTDAVLRYLSWINDLNFNYSYKYISETNIIDNKLHLLELYGEKEEVSLIKEYLNKLLKEKGC